jgi:hypothetical protein
MKTVKQSKIFTIMFSCLAIVALWCLLTGLNRVADYNSWIGFSGCMVVAGTATAVIIYRVACFITARTKGHKVTNGKGRFLLLAFMLSCVFFRVGMTVNESATLNSDCGYFRVIDKVGGKKKHYVVIESHYGQHRLYVDNVEWVRSRIAACVVTGWMGFKYYKEPLKIGPHNID